MSICPIDFRVKLSYNQIEVSEMPDYKEMYFKLFRATTKAIDILEVAQQECEELFLSPEEPNLTVLPSKNDSTKK